MTKNKIGLLLLAVLLIGSLAGCASGPSYQEMMAKMPQLTPDLGRIYLYRTSFLGAAIQTPITLNGEAVGISKAGGFFWVDRPAGEYTVSTTTEVERKCSFTLEGGQTRYVRFDISMGLFVGHVYGVLVDNEVGAKEIESLSYDGAADQAGSKKDAGQ